MEGKENGTYVGPTVIDFVKPDMAVAKGRDLWSCAKHYADEDTVDEAIAIENKNPLR